MKRIGESLLVALLLATKLQAWDSEKISLPTSANLSRADIYVHHAGSHPAGTLILCPGNNGNGEEMADGFQWRSFAQKQNLNLVGLSFASSDESPGEGYFKAETGSGNVLLEELSHAFGSEQSPLLLYGFSRGAQFVYSFAQWKPDRVLAWCAYSATEWQTPARNTSEPRGIIACGDEDEPNYSSAAFQFLKGRSMEEPWTWVSLARVGHSRSAALEAFARAYFASVLLNPGAKGIWLDVDTKSPATTDDIQEHPALAAWLPDENVAGLWKRLHQP